MSDEISIDNATVDGNRYDFVMKWRRAEQGFEVIKIESLDNRMAIANSPKISESATADASSNTLRIELEEPVRGEIHTGVGNLRGWAVGSDKITRIEVLVDGAYVFDAPYGGQRADVAGVFPDIEGAGQSGFSRAFNYSVLSAGPHTITAIAHTQLGDTKESSVSFEVVKFASDFISNPNAIRFKTSLCSMASDEISINDATVAGALYDFKLKWRRAEQGFEIIEIR